MNGIPLAVGEQQVSPGVLGFVIVALLGLALFLLIRSMNKQMRKINFDDGSGTGTEPEPKPEPTPESKPEATTTEATKNEN